MALTRLRRTAELAAKVPTINERMSIALKTFDTVLPQLRTMRNVAEHIDDYAIGGGRDKNISRQSLEVAISDGEVWHWLGFEMDLGVALSASVALFGALKDCERLVPVPPDNSPEPIVASAYGSAVSGRDADQ